MFLTGIVVQLVFLATWVTLGAVGTLAGLYYVFLAAWDIRFGPTPFDPSVLLGCTLLVTDPATSPESRTGKLLFGVLYGSLVLGLCIGLRVIHWPPYFDKILPVPIVNLLVPWLERIGRALEARWTGTWAAWLLGNRFIPAAAYVALFLALLPALKTPAYDGHNPLPRVVSSFSDPMARKVLMAHA